MCLVCDGLEPSSSLESAAGSLPPGVTGRGASVILQRSAAALRFSFPSSDHPVHFANSDILTILLLVALEGLLSADNAMVLAVLALGLPKGQRKQALRYGIIGAFAFRTLAVLFAIQLIQLQWVKLLGAAYLLYLPYRHFMGGQGSTQRRAVPKATPWFGLSPFWATVVRVELTDIVFAIDSVVVAVGMSTKLWVVLTGGILGIIAMRLVIGQLLAIVERYPPLVDGAFVIIAWVGAKLLLEFLNAAGYVHFELPKVLSLGLIVVIFAIALLYSIRQERRRKPTAVERQATDLLSEGEED
jgi:YkoY family integral membrane protein